MGRVFEVTIFSKKGCHLCEAVEEEVRSVEDTSISLTVVDIEGDPTLQAGYLTRVPVVTVGGKEVLDANMMDVGGRWRKTLAGAFA